MTASGATVTWFSGFRRWLASRSRPPEPPHIYWIFNAAWLAQAAYVAAALDVAEVLRERPLSIEQLADRCGARPGPLGQVMRALAGFGVFSRCEDGRWALNSAALPLLADADFSVKSYAAVWGEQLYASAGRMLQQVREGVTGFEQVHGRTIWDHYRHAAVDADRFDTFMSDATTLHVRSILEVYPFARHARVVDVGAGRGRLLAAVLAATPTLRGVWYDRPELLDAATALLTAAGVDDRCERVAGDFLREVPGGADLYLIKHVLHDWPDALAVEILQNIAAAMDTGARLLVIEAVPSEADGQDGLAKLRDLEQMVWTGGRVRSRREFETLLQKAGLVIESLTPTAITDACVLAASRR